MREIIFITGNKGKLSEVSDILINQNLTSRDLDIDEIQSMDLQEIVQAKLMRAHEACNAPCFVEDVSMELNALGGFPGPLIKWFMKSIGADGIAELISKYEDRSAEIICMVGYADEHGVHHFFEGRLTGHIVSPRGDSGFGFDAIFVPDGMEESFAQMGKAKNGISHRYLAFRKFKEFLNS